MQAKHVFVLILADSYIYPLPQTPTPWSWSLTVLGDDSFVYLLCCCSLYDEVMYFVLGLWHKL